MTYLKLLTNQSLVAKIIGTTLIAVTSFAIVTPVLADNGHTSSVIPHSTTSTAQAFVDTLPPTSDPVENEARDFFVFLGEEKPEFVAEFIKVYQGALKNKLNDETIAKRYVVLGAKDFILDHTEYFSAPLLTEAQLAGLEKLAVGSDQDKGEIYGKYIDKNTDWSLIEDIKRLDEEIAELDEEIAELDEESKRLDEENKKIREFNEKMGWN